MIGFQILMCRGAKNATAVSCGKFCSSFFKSSSEPPRSAVALRRGRNSLTLPKRHRGVNDKPQAWQRGTAQVGGSPFYTKPFQIDYPLFSLAVEAQMKTHFAALSCNSLRDLRLAKKNTPQEMFRRVRAATNAPRVGWAVAF